MNFLFNIGRNIFFFARTRPRIERSQSFFVFGLVLSLLSTSYAADSKKVTAQTAQEIQNISNAQLQICLPAIDALAHTNNAQVIKPLSDAFAQESRPVVRRYIVDALGNLRNRTSLPTLQLALQDSDLQVRQSAVAAVGLLSAADQQTVFLQQAAHEKNPVIKRQLIHHLTLLNTPQARQAIQTLNQDSDSKRGKGNVEK